MFNAIIYLIVFFAIQFCVSIGVSFGWKYFTGSPDITTLQLVVSMLAFSVVTIAVFTLAHWCSLSRSYVQSRPWAALSWSVVAAVGLVVPSLWLQELMPELPNLVENEFGMIMGDRLGYLTIGLVVPVAEEVVFRGAIQRSLMETFSSTWAPIVLSALFFAVAHFNPAQLPHALIAGLLLGWMYSRTRSIVPGIAFHWANNTIAYVLYNVLPNPDGTLIEIFGGNQMRVYMALGFSLCIVLPAIFQLNRTLKKAKIGKWWNQA